MDRVAADLLPKRQLTDAELDGLDQILHAASAWHSGEGSLDAVMRIAVIENYDGRLSPGYSRFCAYWLARKHGDARHEALAAVMDHVNAVRMTWTRQGWYSREDLNILRETHHRVLDFQRYKQATNPDQQAA